MSFPCPVPLCRHHTLEPFPMEALLKSHIDASEHAFIDVWQTTGPSPLQIDDIGTDTITMFWQPVPGASHYELQAKDDFKERRKLEVSKALRAIKKRKEMILNVM